MLSFLVRQIVIAIKKEKTWTYLTFFDNRPEAFSEKRWFYNLQRDHPIIILTVSLILKQHSLEKKIQPDPGSDPDPDPDPAFYWHPSQRKSMLPLSICEIKIWGSSNCESVTTENIYGTRVIYDLWICSCIGKYRRQIRQHLKFWLVRPFFASLNTKDRSRLYSSNQFFKRRSNFSVSSLNLTLTLTQHSLEKEIDPDPGPRPTPRFTDTPKLMVAIILI